MARRSNARRMAALRSRCVLVAACFSLVAVGACSGSSDSSSGGGESTLRIAMASDAQSLDPPNFVLVGDFTRDVLLYEGLVKLTNSGEVEPSLATSWKQVSPTEWDFALREGVMFHDGTALDSQAVKVSLERAATQSQGKGFLGVIKEVQTPDTMTARLILKEPFSSILNNLTVPVASIISPKALTEKGDQISREPVGTGPYTFKQWRPDTDMTFVANRDYWGDKATVDTVQFIPIPEASTRFSALQSGDVDVIENPPPGELKTLEASADLGVLTEPRARPIFLGFNLKAVDNLAFRQAIAHAIDRTAIVDFVLEGVGTPADEGIVTPEFLKNDPAIKLDYDPAKAKQLLAESGVKDPTITLTLPSARYLKDKEIGEVIQEQLSAVGIKLVLDLQEPGTWYQSLLDHKTEMYYLGFGLSTGDPADLLTRVFRSDALNNVSQVDDPAIDKAIDSLQKLDAGSAERNQLMQDVQRTLIEDEAVVIPIYHMVNFYGVSKKVKNLHTTPTELLDLSKVTVE